MAVPITWRTGMARKIMLIMMLSALDGHRSLGGVDTVCQAHLQGLREMEPRHDYTVIGFNPANDLEKNGEQYNYCQNIKVLCYNYKRSQGSTKYLPNILKNEMLIRSVIKTHKPDVVHSHMPCWHMRKYRSEKKILTLHQYQGLGRKPVDFFNDRLHLDIVEPTSIRNADLITTVSKDIISLLGPSLINYPAYVPNPINERYFSVVREPIKDEMINLFMAGTITRNKRIMDGIETVRQLKLLYPQIRLTIAGGFDSDAAYSQTLFDFVDANALQENVRFTGLLPIQDVLKCLAKTQIALFLSGSESFGLAPLECLAAGIPLITTDVGVMKWHKDEFQARDVDIVPVGDVGSIKNAVSRRIEKKKFGVHEDVRPFLAKYFSLRACIGQYVQAYGSA
jgi:polysaccharide biosynthesis protein VpsD